VFGDSAKPLKPRQPAPARRASAPPPLAPAFDPFDGVDKPPKAEPRVEEVSLGPRLVPAPKPATRKKKREVDDNRSPWLTIWYRPRATVQRIVDDGVNEGVNLLFLIWGLRLALDDYVYGISATLNRPLSFIAGVIIRKTTITTLLAYFLFALIMRLMCGLLGGQGDIRAARSALAWSAIPSVIVLVLWGVLYQMVGAAMFHGDPLGALTPARRPMATVIMELGRTIEFSQFVFLPLCVAGAMGFSVWRALLACLLTFASLLVIAVALIASGTILRGAG
jgi:hypothetical protein